LRRCARRAVAPFPAIGALECAISRSCAVEVLLRPRTTVAPRCRGARCLPYSAERSPDRVRARPQVGAIVRWHASNADGLCQCHVSATVSAACDAGGQCRSASVSLCRPAPCPGPCPHARADGGDPMAVPLLPPRSTWGLRRACASACRKTDALGKIDAFEFCREVNPLSVCLSPPPQNPRR
jgi:hypothetical protein